MPDQEHLDNLINACSRSKYENLTTAGLKEIIERFSFSIMKDSRFEDVRNISNALYLMKYLIENWSLVDKTSRITKKICIKVLYIVLLLSKKSPEYRNLLNYGVSEAGKNWEIKTGDYPYLTAKEQKRILSKVAHEEERLDVDILFSESHPGWDLPHIKKDCDLLNVRRNLIKALQKVKLYKGPENQKIRRLKAFYMVIKEEMESENAFGVLNVLPLEFCKIQIEKLLSEIPQDEEKHDLKTSSLNEGAIEKAEQTFFTQGATEGQYLPIPEWAEWFIDTGKNAAATASLNQRIIIGFSVPTISYAALFFLLGHETLRAERMMCEQFEKDSYFELLTKCEPNEALLIKEDNRWMRCWFRGVEKIEDQKFLKVKIPGGERRRCKRLIRSDDATIIRKAVDPEREVAEHQVGFQMMGFNAMLAYYKKAEEKVLELLLRNRISHFLVGNMTGIRKEIETEKLHLKLRKDEYLGISFQDILRFKNFITDFDFPRGIIISSRTEIEVLEQTEEPDIVVYNGSLAYLNFQGEIDCPLQIIFLDPAEAQFSSACGELMARYYDREDDLKFFTKMPSCIEALAFTE